MITIEYRKRIKEYLYQGSMKAIARSAGVTTATIANWFCGIVMNICVDHKKRVWLSYEYLKGYGISENSIDNWKKRHIGRYYHFDQQTFIDYDTIPAPTRKKLPDKLFLIQDAGDEEQNALQHYFFRELNEAYNSMNVNKFRNEILKISDRFSNDELLKFSRKAAVFERILSIYHGKKGDINPLHKAYLQLFPDGFSMRNRLIMAIKQARTKGILSVAVNRSCLNKPKETYTENYKFYAMSILSHSKGYYISDAYKKFKEQCEDDKIKTPSFKWFWNYYRNNKNDIDRGRLGASAWEAKNMYYMKLIQAEYSGDQFQIDGWRIPIYGKKLNSKGMIERFVTYNLLTVMDVHSRKIIGYDISEKENTETILKGIEMAIKETGILPFEIVSDNHSFHKTEEAGNLKKELFDLGVTWTVSSNPKRKVVVERAFETLGDKHFRNQYGYIGGGIRSKKENAIPPSELVDKYTKTDNLLTYTQIVGITAGVIDEYNNTVIDKLKDTPNTMYEKSERPHAIPCNDFQRALLFFPKKTLKVSHGQITMIQGVHKYEYILPSEFFKKYNNQKISVRYIKDKPDEVYLFDLQTDEHICISKQKEAAHAALANQTDRDKQLFLNNSGRNKGAKSDKKMEKLFKAANGDNLDAHERISKRTASKDMIAEIKGNPVIRGQIQEQFGFNVDKIPDLPKIDEMLIPGLKPRKEKDIKRPCQREGIMEKLTIGI